MQRLTTRFLKAQWVPVLPGPLVPLALFVFCGGPPPLTVDMPLHLEEHLDTATIVGSQVPTDLPPPVEWSFDEPQPGWKATAPRPFPAGIRPATVSQTDDALQITPIAPSSSTFDT